MKPPVKPYLPTMAIGSGPGLNLDNDNVERMDGTDKAELRKTRELVRLQRDEVKAVKLHLERYDEALKDIQNSIGILTGHLRGVLNAVEDLAKTVKEKSNG